MRLILLLVVGACVAFYLLVVRRRALPPADTPAALPPGDRLPDTPARVNAPVASPAPAPSPAAPSPATPSARPAPAPRGDDPQALLARIQALGDVPFVSPGRGAVVLMRFGHGLPESESLPGLSDVDRTLAVLRRTIQHPHEHDSSFDQFGAGRWFYFRRHVTEGDRRWDFEVDVLVRSDGGVAVEDARIVRPGDRDAEDEGDAGEDGDEPVEDADTDQAPLPGAQAGAGAAVAAAAAAAAEAAANVGVPPAGTVACPCCGYATLRGRGGYEICAVCFWEDDGQDEADAAVSRGGPNRVSLREGRRNFLALGASVPADVSKVRKPTAEEVQLRRFDAEGVEIAEGVDGG